jgi:SpoVK/Ycf46/Vps4 family AAA+-type ATPase
MEGLQEVKEQVLSLVGQIRVLKMREERGLPVPSMPYHLVFTGNPGTGKTTVAQIVGQIYRALGILSDGHIVYSQYSELVAYYVGQTAIKTKEVVDQAKGNVLLIEQVYLLKQNGGMGFGREALDTLSAEMKEAKDVAVIVVGYKNMMEDLLESDEGLRARFRMAIDFRDYTREELYRIFLRMVQQNGYQLTEEAKALVYQYVQDENNQFAGNGKDMHKMLMSIVAKQSARVFATSVPAGEDLTITAEDLPFAASVNH